MESEVRSLHVPPIINNQLNCSRVQIIYSLYVPLFQSRPFSVSIPLNIVFQTLQKSKPNKNFEFGKHSWIASQSPSHLSHPSENAEI
jgi:hypothetical protein